jgi:hypothetical protein
MARGKVSPSAVVLSLVTGLTASGIGLLAYIRFQHPKQFADASVKLSRPELSDEYTRKWGVYGTGLFDSLPSQVKNFVSIPNMAEKIEEKRKQRKEQIRQTLEDLKPQQK